MAAPDSFAEPSVSSCTAGAVHTWPYATTVFDYVRRSMPVTAPQSLSNDEVYAVTAYLLHLNGIIGADDVMDAKSLPAVKMPNRDSFTSLYKPKK